MRDYDPTTGRYIQADPLGLVDGASVYGYVGQNPGRYVDPRGEFGIPGAIIGGGTQLGIQVAVNMIYGEMTLRQAINCVDLSKVAAGVFLGALGTTPAKVLKTGGGVANAVGVFGVGQLLNLEMPPVMVGELVGGESCDCDVGGFPEWMKSWIIF